MLNICVLECASITIFAECELNVDLLCLWDYHNQTNGTKDRSASVNLTFDSRMRSNWCHLAKFSVSGQDVNCYICSISKNVRYTEIWMSGHTFVNIKSDIPAFIKFSNYFLWLKSFWDLQKMWRPYLSYTSLCGWSYTKFSISLCQ